MDVERGRTVKGWRPRRLGERVLLWLGSGSCWLPLPFLPPSAAVCLLFPARLLTFLLPLSSSASQFPAFSWSVFVFYSGLPIRSESTNLEKPVWDHILTCALPGRWISPLFCLIFLILESGNNLSSLS